MAEEQENKEQNEEKEAPEEEESTESEEQDEASTDDSDRSEEEQQEQNQKDRKKKGSGSRGKGKSSSHGGSRDSEELEESVVHVNRCCKVVRGGKRFSFSALVVAGNRNGKISYGFGKGNQVPTAIQKAVSDSRKRIIEVPIVHGTIPHTVQKKYCATELLLRPASPGTGVIACLPVRTVVNLAGITDLLTKIQGSTNPINTVKAAYEGLKSLRTKEKIEDLRDVKIK